MKIHQVLHVPLDCSLPSPPGPEPRLPGASLDQELSPSFPPAIRTRHKVPTSGLASVISHPGSFMDTCPPRPRTHPPNTVPGYRPPS